jgi:hypothetical protein
MTMMLALFFQATRAEERALKRSTDESGNVIETHEHTGDFRECCFEKSSRKRSQFLVGIYNELSP